MLIFVELFKWMFTPILKITSIRFKFFFFSQFKVKTHVFQVDMQVNISCSGFQSRYRDLLELMSAYLPWRSHNSDWKSTQKLFTYKVYPRTHIQNTYFFLVYIKKDCASSWRLSTKPQKNEGPLFRLYK